MHQHNYQLNITKGNVYGNVRVFASPMAAKNISFSWNYLKHIFSRIV